MLILDTAAYVALLALVIVPVALAAVALVTGSAQFFVTNHRIRVARHESIPTYYGRLHFAH